jgi:hypothetical protein
MLGLCLLQQFAEVEQIGHSPIAVVAREQPESDRLLLASQWRNMTPKLRCSQLSW